ncbi:hypothetical protein [Neoroseomonas soli]|uniref:Uncharacterized protein n=1 Tax=Neoroseomonas soli TaxID=1081025 RepID=A0A9X9X2P6_9PROT|nr:hypothetical protein [Neoroseomonas soli]MBR0673675.1 hypothetical protein [Neoroseomonas soli]
MADPRQDPVPEDELRHDVVDCPICGEPTMPNLLSDGSCVCSCPAERALPLGGDTPLTIPPPVDDTSFVARQHDSSAGLPAAGNQFGRNIQTDDFKPLADPPGDG